MPIIYYVLAIGLLVWLILALHVWSRKGGKLRANGQSSDTNSGRRDSGADAEGERRGRN
jgi:hypothetical protein